MPFLFSFGQNSLHYTILKGYTKNFNEQSIELYTNYGNTEILELSKEKGAVVHAKCLVISNKSLKHILVLNIVVISANCIIVIACLLCQY